MAEQFIVYLAIMLKLILGRVKAFATSFGLYGKSINSPISACCLMDVIGIKLGIRN